LENYSNVIQRVHKNGHRFHEHTHAHTITHATVKQPFRFCGRSDTILWQNAA